MRTALTLDLAKAQVCEFLRLIAQTPDETEVSIHLWWDGRLDEAPNCVGVRIAEISFVTQTETSMCVASWMACEPQCLGIIAAAERCIIERMVCTCDDEVWDDEIKDADWRLNELVNHQTEG